MDQNKEKYFHVFAHAGEVGESYLDMVLKEAKESTFDPKTHELAYLAVLVATGLEQGIIMHTKQAKALGATREEIKSAALVVPAVGFPAIIGLKTALNSFDEKI